MADRRDKDTGEMVNINRATADELQALEGIGPKRAQAILEYRNRRGWFVIPEDIMKVRGNQTFIMPDGRLAKIRKVCQ